MVVLVVVILWQQQAEVVVRGGAPGRELLVLVRMVVGGLMPRRGSATNKWPGCWWIEWLVYQPFNCRNKGNLVD